MPLLLIADDEQNLVVLGQSSGGGREPASRQRAPLAFPAGPLVSLGALGHGRIFIDLVCELGVVLHSRPDEPRDDAEVGSRLVDVAATCAKGSHDLVNVEPGAKDERLATASSPLVEPDQGIPGLPTSSRGGIEQLDRAPGKAEGTLYGWLLVLWHVSHCLTADFGGGKIRRGAAKHASAGGSREPAGISLAAVRSGCATGRSGGEPSSSAGPPPAPRPARMAASLAMVRAGCGRRCTRWLLRR